MSLVTPVAVSLCTTQTALYSCFVSLLSSSWIVSGGAPSPHSTSTAVTSRPSRCIMSIQRWLNCP